jgi:L-threonylcarbamoyladenylate synthase
MPFSTQILKCDSTSISFPADSDSPVVSCSETLESLKLASQHLRDEQTVAFPTETVYGLGALALKTSAASKIFSTKGRPPDNPLIVHVSSFSMLQSILPPTFKLPQTYEHLMKRFWPGALTLLFPSDPAIIPSIITANQPTVAIRMPSHPVARALIAFTGSPIAAPSANSSGKPSPTKAEHVHRDLDGKLRYILDGGACGVGLESTVVDGLQPDQNLRVLRPGGVTVEDIQKVVEEEMPGSGIKVLVHKRDYQDEEMEVAPTTPGMKYRHYSPSVPVVLLATVSAPPNGVQPTGIEQLWDAAQGQTIGLLCPSDSGLLPGLSQKLNMKHFALGSVRDPASIAASLFDGLLTLERQGVDVIWIEEVKEDEEGLAVMNRVRKAAGEVHFLN